MARIEWVARRLDNWTLWKERQGGGGLGFATCSIFANGPAARGQAEAVVPVDEIDASITDDAVESLRISAGHLYKTLQLYYLRNLGIKGTAAAMQRAESTIHANLGAADLKIATWFEERRQRGAAAAAAGSVRAQLHAGPAIALHLEARAAAKHKPKEKRRKRVDQVVASPIELVGPPRPRRSRPVLRLRREPSSEAEAESKDCGCLGHCERDKATCPYPF